MDVPAPPKAWAGPQGAQMLQGTWVQCQRRFCWMRAIGTCWEEGEAGWNTHLCPGFAAGNCPWEAGSAARSAPSQQRKEERRSLLHAHGRSKPQHQEAPPRCAGFGEPRSPPSLQRGAGNLGWGHDFPQNVQVLRNEGRDGLLCLSPVRTQPPPAPTPLRRHGGSSPAAFSPTSLATLMPSAQSPISHPSVLL